MKRKHNEGFTLTEILAVLVIVTILVLVIAKQILSYAERSKENADIQVAQEIHYAIAVTMQNTNVPQAEMPEMMATQEDITRMPDNTFRQQAEEILGSDMEEVSERLKSKTYRGQQILYQIMPGNHVVVTIPSKDGTNREPITAQ